MFKSSAPVAKINLPRSSLQKHITRRTIQKNNEALLGLGLFTIFTANSEVNMMAGVLAPCAGCSRRKHLYVQGSLNFINRSNARRNMAAKMTQSQLVKELAEASGTNGKVAKTFVESFAAIAVRETKKNGLFVLPGIGRLVRVDRKARMGRNPATGEAIKIPAKKVVKFRVAKIVKDAIVPPKKK
jgi:DNA-binding protein HU-beta